MSTHEDRRNIAVHRHLHPAITRAMVASVLWMVGAVWLLFDDGAGTTLSLIVVTGFAAAFVGTPFILWRASPHRTHKTEGRLSTWLDGEFEADNGRIGGRDAMAMALLLPVACAIGLTAISFVAYLAAAGAL